MIGPEVTVPDVTEAVIGYRQFMLENHTQHNYRLVSPHAREPWPKVQMTAKCNVEVKVPEGIVVPGPIKQHSAPQKDCGCGIYAYFEPCPVSESRDSLRYYMGGPTPSIITALVSLEGRIEVHARGMRAQRARICALGGHLGLSADECAGLNEIAKRFEVPVVHQSGLAQLAPEYGRPLREDMRPAAPKPPESPPEPPESFSAYYAEPTRPPSLRGARRMLWGATAVNLGGAAWNLLHAGGVL